MQTAYLEPIMQRRHQRKPLGKQDHIVCQKNPRKNFQESVLRQNNKLMPSLKRKQQSKRIT